MRYVENKLWPHIEKTASCWLWRGKSNRYGYGTVWLLAHKLAFELAKGPIPDGMEILHSCDNRKCVNPAHLSLGTHQDNLHDMMMKGRYKLGSRPGTMNGNAKLTCEQVVEIRRRYVKGKNQHDGNCSKLAREFGITPSAVLGIVKRRTWGLLA